MQGYTRDEIGKLFGVSPELISERPVSTVYYVGGPLDGHTLQWTNPPLTIVAPILPTITAEDWIRGPDDDPVSIPPQPETVIYHRLRFAYFLGEHIYVADDLYHDIVLGHGTVDNDQFTSKIRGVIAFERMIYAQIRATLFGDEEADLGYLSEARMDGTKEYPLDIIARIDSVVDEVVRNNGREE